MLFAFASMNESIREIGRECYKQNSENLKDFYYTHRIALSSLAKTEIKSYAICKKCALEQALNADEH